jgi:hypothetical protein
VIGSAAPPTPEARSGAARLAVFGFEIFTLSWNLKRTVSLPLNTHRALWGYTMRNTLMICVDYEYILVGDEILTVDPRTLMIVAVISA